MAELEHRRQERIAATTSRIVRTARTAAHDANPFVLVGRAAERVGELAERTARTAEQHGRRRLGRLLTELATVNIFAVPGAGLERATHGAFSSRRDTLRHCVLFVVSWFAGARIIEYGLDALATLPLVADAIHNTLRVAGFTFATLTDVTRVPSVLRRWPASSSSCCATPPRSNGWRLPRVATVLDPTSSHRAPE